MSVVLDDHSLFYASVPKVACTSIKLMFFKLENGFPFKGYIINGKRRHIHQYYNGSLWEKTPHKRIKGYHRVTLVRDPVDRFLSAYKNRVLQLKELSFEKAGPKLANLGLDYDPDLSVFIERFDDYYSASNSIHHHTRPMIDFLGEDATYYSKIYPLREMKKFVTDISNYVGSDLEIGNFQKSGSNLNKDDLSRAQLDKIKSFYRFDYSAFGEFL